MSFHVTASDNLGDLVTVDQAISLSNAGAQAARGGNHALAAEKHAQALALRQQFYGLDSVHVGISANGLGEALLALGRLDDAEQALMVALRCRDELGLGPKFDAAVTRENVGCLWEARGKWAEAKEVRLKGEEKRLRGEEAGMVCGNDKCPGLMFTRAELKACGACTSVFYCNPECQKQDWKSRHKAFCKARIAASIAS